MVATVPPIAITRFGTRQRNNPHRRRNRSQRRARRRSVADRLAIKITMTTRRRFGTNNPRNLRHPRTVRKTIPALSRRWSAKTAPSQSNANPAAAPKNAASRPRSRHLRLRHARPHLSLHRRLCQCRVLQRQPTRRHPPRRAWNHNPLRLAQNLHARNHVPSRVRNPSRIQIVPSVIGKCVLTSSRS